MLRKGLDEMRSLGRKHRLYALVVRHAQAGECATHQAVHGRRWHASLTRKAQRGCACVAAERFDMVFRDSHVRILCEYA